MEMPIRRRRDTYRDAHEGVYRKGEGCPQGCIWRCLLGGERGDGGVHRDAHTKREGSF